MSKTALKSKRIDRRFQLSDDSVNVYDFRVLTSGFDLAAFQKNPIGYFMHDRDGGVLLRWTDLTVEDNKIFGYPEINLSHARAEQTIAEIESGFLNAASVGHIVALEISNDPKDLLPNQKGPTLLKWYCKECSLVDIPGNANSLAPALSDADGNPINLADFTNPKIKDTMSKIEYTPEQLGKMNLKAEATEVEVSKAFDDLVAKANRADEAEKKFKDLAATTVTKEVNDLCDQGVTNGKLTVELSTKLKSSYADNPDGLKDLISAMPVYKSIATQTSENPQAKKLADLMAKSWDDLDKSGQLPELKALDEKSFVEKRAERFPSK